MEDHSINQERELFARENSILRVVAGSHAYGTNIEGSDWDERGIFVNNMKELIYPVNYFEQVQCEKDDVVLYELKRYMNLLLEQNPNIMEILWVDDSDVLFKTEVGEALRDNKHKFLTSKVNNTYVEYANSQLKRIKGHNKWINNPQKEEPPEAKDFISVMFNSTSNAEFNKKAPLKGFAAIHLGSKMYALYDAEKIGYNGANWINKVGNIVEVDKSKRGDFLLTNRRFDLLVKYNEDLYKDAHDKWKNYWSWKNNRNEKRSVLEESHGYDTKHAMHTIRLLQSGKCILENGVVPVKQNNPQFLLDIREGKYSYDELLKMANKLMDEINVISAKTNLPKNIDKDMFQDFVINLYKIHWQNSLKSTKKIVSKM